MKCLFLSCSLLLVIWSCTSDEEVTIEEITDQTFDPYIERFLVEADLRSANPQNILGRAIETLTIRFNNELEDYCGFAISTTPVNAEIIISSRSNCWRLINGSDREILIFHELGHAILRRQHLNDTLSNGDWKSMMFDGNQFGLYDGRSEKRKYYLDELFDPDTLQPEWSID